MSNPRMTIGLELATMPPIRSYRPLLLLARLLRLDSVLVADHVQNFIPSALWDPHLLWRAADSPSPHALFDYQVLLGYLAPSAGRLRLGVGVTDPIRHHPLLIAQMMSTLAHLTRQPPILGLGSGLRLNLAPYGLDAPDRVGRLEEAVQIIHQCFACPGPIDFCGRHYHLAHAVMDLRPPPGRTPALWLAAHGPRTLRLTGQYADGWYPAMITTPAEYAARLQIIRTAAQEAGRDPAAITPALYQGILAAPTMQEAQAMLDTPTVRLFALIAAPVTAWQRCGVAHPLGEDYQPYVGFLPEQYDRPTLERALAAVPPELLGYGLLWGTPAQVARKLRAFGRAGMRHAVLVPWSGLISPRAALYSFLALGQIARWLRHAGRTQDPAERAVSGKGESHAAG